MNYTPFPSAAPCHCPAPAGRSACARSSLRAPTFAGLGALLFRLLP